MVALRLTTTVLHHICATPHCTLGTVRPVVVASCVHNITQQTVTGSCVTDTHRLCTRGCLVTGAMPSVMLRHVTTSYS